jgi:quercetin dioxygenase-like cupin family protein
MPYVAPDEAVNAGAMDLQAIRREMGPPPWRKALIGTETTRWVLWEMQAGYVQRAHKHPHAEEVFHVLDGQAVFRFGEDETEHSAGPGTVLLARRGVVHVVSVPGPGSLFMLVSVTPNADVPDETVEV